MSAYPIQRDPLPSLGAADKAHDPSGGGHLLAVPDLSGYHELRIWAESFADAQDHRVRLFNRLGLKADGKPNKTGAAVDADSFDHIVAPVLASETHIKRMMLHCYRRVAPAGVIEWQKSTFGIGEHLLGRLLGTLGHPRIATPYHWEGEGDTRTLVADQVYERTVRQLWTYCGHGEALRRRKGMTAEEAFGLGSPRCKTLVHLLAEASIKCRIEPRLLAVATGPAADPTTSPHPPTIRPPTTGESAGGDLSADQPDDETVATGTTADRRYRLLYEQRRAHTATTHPDWTPGHSHNDALRIVGKRILADLWAAS